MNGTERDDKDARAFNPLAGGLEAYLEAEERGEIEPPPLHYGRDGAAKGACGEVGFVREHSYAVTCATCKPIAIADEAKRAAKLAKTKQRRAARRRGAA